MRNALQLPPEKLQSRQEPPYRTGPDGGKLSLYRGRIFEVGSELSNYCVTINRDLSEIALSGIFRRAMELAFADAAMEGGPGGVGDLFMYNILEETLDLRFQDESLLQMALTHRSFIYEKAGRGQQCNERLEFLGDSVLACVTADFLYRTFPELDEGELSDVRAMLVKGDTLAKFASEMGIERFLRMGKGERNAGISLRILASTFEALLGAIYLDQGLEKARACLLPRIQPLAHQIVEKRLFKDNKSRFQEMAQAHDGITPIYRMTSQEGPSHDREFTVEVLVGEQVAGIGQGRNKQTAEQAAASAALRQRGWL